MHATNNHSDIILPLKFLLMMFLTDAIFVSNGAHFHKAVSGQNCHSAFIHTALQTHYGVVSISFLCMAFFKFIIHLKTTISKSN